MRKIGSWVMSDDRHFLAAVGIAIVVLVFAVRPLFWSGVIAAESVVYERSESVSEDVENRALGYARMLVDEVEIRFDGEAKCFDPEHAIGCVRNIDHRVIHLNQSLGERALDDPAHFASVVIHEAAHVFDFEHDLDLSGFEAYSDTAPAHEVFADCAAQAIVWVAEGAYLDCPESGQRRALDLLGIKSAEMVWDGDRVDVSVQR